MFALVLTLAPALLLASASGFAQTLPSGATVVSGNVTVTQPNGQQMTVNQGSNSAIINWRNFSIGSGNSVTFIQPSASSVALNRVVGGSPSSIFGSLTANGKVFLVNPAGVLFAPGASVNTGSFVASTLGISDSDFLAGRYTFQNGGSAGGIVNQGSVTARDGTVVFIAPQIVNAGSVNATAGVVLAAGDRVSMTLDAESPLSVSVDASALKAGIVNSGAIFSGGPVLLSAQARDSALDTVINSSGVIRAASIASNGEDIQLNGGAHGIVSIGGTLDASGAGASGHGGSITVTGDQLTLAGSAKLDASGAVGGGTILVGGAAHGAGPLQNASTTTVAQGAVLDASATNTGNGGQVVVWSNDSTRFSGQIVSRGGTNGGDGGNAEISSKGVFVVDGAVDLSAPHGRRGTLLLDPFDLCIVATDPGTCGTLASGTGTYVAGASDSYVLASTLVGLSSTTNLVLQAANSIIFLTSLALNTTTAPSSQGSISLQAGNAIVMNGSSLSTDGGNISMVAGTGGMSLGNLSSGTGSITLGLTDANGTITQASGSSISGSGGLTLTGGQLELSQANAYSGGTNVTGGTLAFSGSGTAGTSAITVGSGGVLDVQSTLANALTLNGGTLETSTGSGSVSGLVTLNGSNTFSTGNSATLTVSGVIANGAPAGALTVNGTGTVVLTGVNTFSGGTTINGGTLALTGSGTAGTLAISVGSGAALDVQNILSNAVTLTGGTLETTTGTGTVSGPVVLNSSGIFATGSGATLTVSGAVSGGASPNALTVSGPGTVVLNGVNTYIGGTLVSGGTLQGNTQSLQGSITNNASLVFDQASNGTFNGTISGTGAVTKQNTGTLTLNGLQSYGGGTKVTGGVLQGDTASLQGGIVLDNSTGLIFDQASNGTFGGTISGTGAVTKQNTGTLTFDTTQTYGGGTSVTGGILALTGSGTAGAQSGLITIGSGAALDVQNILANAVTLNGGTLETTTGTGTVNGTVVLNNSGIFATGSGATLTVSGAVSGGASPNALTVSGPGTVVLSGVNTYTGGTLVSGGTLQGNAQSLQGSITNNASLVFDQASNGTFGGTISGTGTVTKQNTGTLTFSTTQSYGGGTNVTGGTLVLTGSGAAGAQSGLITIGSGAALDVQNTLANAVTLSGGTLETSTGSGLVNGQVTLNGSNTFSTGTSATLTVSGAVVDGAPAGALTVNGTGTVVLTGVNTFSGGTTINGGTLALTGSGTAGTSAITVGTGAALDVQNTLANAVTLNSGTLETTAGTGTVSGSVVLNNSGIFATGSGATLTVSGVVSGGASPNALTVSGPGTVVLSGVNTYTGGTLVSGGTLQGNTQSLQGGITNNASLVFDQASNGTFNGTISGTGAVTKQNTGTLTFDTTQTYGGGTSVTGGTLTLTGSGVAGTSAITVGSGAALDVQNTLANALTLNGGGTLEATTGSGSVTGLVTLNGSNTFSTGNSATLTVSSVVVDGAPAGALTVNGTGTVALTGVNTFSGGTTINGGTLALTGSGTAGTSAISVGSGAALDVQNILSNAVTLNGGTLETTTGTGTVSGPVVLNNSGIFATGSGATLTVSGAVSGGASPNALTVSGPGTVVLNGVNTYIGGTLVSGGTLQGNAQSLQGSITNNASLVFDQASNGTFNGTISGTGAVTKQNTGTLTLNGPQSYGGGTKVTGGALQGDTASLQGGIVLDNSTGLIFDQASNGTFGGTISGTGTVTKQNTGTLTFDTTQTYGGGTSVTGGTLTLTGSGVAGTSAITVGSGAALDVQNTLANALTLNGGGTLETTTGSGSVNGLVTLNGSNTFSTGNSATLTVSSVIANGAPAGALTVNGTGTVVLTGVNTFSGGTTINGGTLALTGSGTAGTSAITVGGGAALDVQNTLANAVTLNSGTLETTTGSGNVNGPVTLNGSNTFATGSGARLTVNGVVGDGTSQGSLIVSGSGTVVLTGLNTYSSGTTVASGTLQGDAGSLHGDIGLAGATALVFDQAANGTFNGSISGAGAVTKQNAGTLTFNGTQSYGGGTTVTGGALQGNTTSLQGNIALAVGTGLVFDQASNGTFNGAISGGGAVTKQNSGTLTIGTGQTYTGGSSVTGGTLALKNTGTAGATTGALTVDSGAALDVQNTLANAVTLNGGTLETTTGSGIVNGAVTLNGSNSLATGSNAALTINGALGNGTSAGALTINGAGLVTLNGISRFTGGTSVTGGTLQGNTASLNGNIALGGGTHLVFDQASDSTFGGEISGGGAVSKQNAGTLSFDTTQTYTGGTAVTAGTLALKNSGTAGAPAGAITVGSGASLDLQNTLANAVTLAGGTLETTAGNGVANGPITLSSGGSAVSAASSATLTVNGVIRDNGTGQSLTKQGAGLVTLNGVDSYTGGTSITAGTLAVGAGGSLGSGLATVNGGTTLALAGTTLGNNLSLLDGSTLVASGGVNTLSGALNVRGATFDIGSGSTLSAANAFNHFTGAATFTGGGSLNLTADTGGIQLGTTTLANLKLQSDGAVTQSAAATITGTTSIATTGGATITLNEANQFGSALQLSGGPASVNSAGALNFGASNVTSLNASAGGDITQTGALQVSGATTLSTPNGNLILDLANTFGALVTARAASGSLTSAQDLALALSTPGTMNVTAGGALTVSGTAGTLSTTSGGATTFGGTLIGDALTIVAGGLVTTASGVSVTAKSITLASKDNQNIGAARPAEFALDNVGKLSLVSGHDAFFLLPDGQQTRFSIGNKVNCARVNMGPCIGNNVLISAISSVQAGIQAAMVNQMHQEDEFTLKVKYGFAGDLEQVQTYPHEGDLEVRLPAPCQLADHAVAEARDESVRLRAAEICP
ncbi:autotransporter-associated beta strand repeat-containing protein [Paraburkholderia haematera]|uniref:autotransporter-associated beta strand repeat-containing protein n=1 Tax=Paraburkholderia haematera TaxID=2793077 RepID=UPI001B8BB202|nr:autotransporter-associated beta strand repeat-containing protein [Paraburkholderia haematera]